MFIGFPCAIRSRLTTSYHSAITAYTRAVNEMVKRSSGSFHDAASIACEARLLARHYRGQLQQHCREHACEGFADRLTP